MKNKSLIILIAVFVLLIAGAGFLYKNLSAGVENNQLQIQATPTPVSSEAPDNSGTPSSPETSEEPQRIQAPDCVVYDKEGNEFLLSDFRGKPTIINFWASWCIYCIAEMPEFQAKYEELGDEVNFLMINVTDGAQETVESASKLIEDGGYTFPVYYDTDQIAAYTYGAYSLPLTFGIDAEGYAVVKANGAIGAEDIDKIVEMIK